MKRLFSCFLILLHTLANARVFAPVEEIVAAKAGIQAVAASTVVGTLNHQGNVFKAVEDLGKPKALKSIGTAIATAGLLGPAPEGGVFSADFAENLAAHGAQHLSYGLKAGAISFAINGGSGEGALKAAGLLAVANAVQASAANKLGVLRQEGLDSFTHKMGHALAGAAAGAILDPKNPSKGAAAGAIGAVVGEVVAEWQLGLPQLLENKEHLRPQDLPTREQVQTARDIGMLSAATAALLTRQDVGIATLTANTAVENNNKLVVEGLKYVAKLAWQKSKHLFAKRAAKEVQKETAKRSAKEIGQKSAKSVAKELQKPQKTIGKGRHQVMKPEFRAGGDHTVFKVNKEGKITHYETYAKNPRNPSGFDSKKRVDLVGEAHFNKKTGTEISTPHVTGKDIPGGVRPARPDEILNQ